MVGMVSPEVYKKISSQISTKDLSTLLKVSSALTSTLDLPNVLQIAIESAVELLSLDTGAIYTIDNNQLFLGATTPPLPPKFPPELRIANLNDHPHIQNTTITKVPVYIEDAEKADLSPAEKTVVEARHLISILYFPLILKDTPIGVYILGTTQAVREFSEEQIELCSILSHQVSMAISNARLFQEAQKAIIDLTHAYDNTLEGWSGMLDMRDHEMDEHTRRVADLTVELATKMGIDQPELAHVRRGAILHDIGKIGIPDGILRKKGKLNDDEWAIIRSHPSKAYQFLSKVDYLIPALEIPYCHHERWDGSGYPRGLMGDQIPRAALIFAVVDVYDALSSDRPYRKAWETGKILRYIENQSGKQFSPQVVRAFLELLQAH